MAKHKAFLSQGAVSNTNMACIKPGRAEFFLFGEYHGYQEPGAPFTNMV